MQGMKGRTSRTTCERAQGQGQRAALLARAIFQLRFFNDLS